MKREQILGTLNQIKAGLMETHLEQTAHYIFTGTHVLTYNDRISIAAPLKTDFQVTVMAADLHKVIADIPDDEIELEYEGDNNQLVIVSATTQAGIATYTVSKEMTDLMKSLGLDKLKNKDWEKLPDRFTEGVSLCSFSASRESTDEAFSSIHVMTDRIISSDQIRISRFMFEDTGPHMDFMLPVEAAKHLIKMNVHEIQVGNAWTHFRNFEGKITFSARLVEAQLPENTEGFLKIKGDEVILPEGMDKALDAVMVFAAGEDDDERMAMIKFKAGKMICESEREGGWIERTVPIPGLKKPGVGAIAINPIFFRDILRMATKMIFTADKAKFVTDRFEHIIALPEDEN